MVSFDEDNLIYNRFDLIYGNDFERMEIADQDRTYSVAVHFNYEKAVLNVWGKKLPQWVFEQAVENVFREHGEIRYIEITQGGNNYRDCLCEGDDIRIVMPETEQELLQRLKAKHRYNLNRQIRMLEDQYGSLSAAVYGRNIPYKYVDLYFRWKKESHGIDYNMTPQQYLKEYHVTDAILLKADERPIGIIFFCLVEDTAYLENFSFDSELARYSPGYITYVFFLKELILRNCRLLFLGGGEYEYKRRFGAEQRTVYNGVIYRREVFEEINRFFAAQEIRSYAIYGLGTGGEEFLQVRNLMEAKLIYGIDRQEKQMDTLQTYMPSEALPNVDAVLITLKSRNREIEEFLRQRFSKVFYWEDLSKRDMIKKL